MKNTNQRILPFAMSKKINAEELKEVMAGGSTQPTGTGTYQNGCFDGYIDINVD